MAQTKTKNIQNYDWSYVKEKIFKSYSTYLFLRTQSMFEYQNLPDSIPARYFEKYLQENGQCCVCSVDGTLYALIGSPGGELDAYYQPTTYVVSNPYLKFSKDLTIDKDCVLCRNDNEMMGLTPLISRYAGMLTENLITMRRSDIMMRTMYFISAPDDKSLQSSKLFLDDIEEGTSGVVADSPFFDGIKTHTTNTSSSDYMIQFIELHQYLKGSLYNELGLNANFNMKRESLSKDELGLNDDALMPLIDEMLSQRRIAVGKINELFDQNISVDYGSAWKENYATKFVQAQSEYGASETSAAAVAGDAVSQPNDEDPQNADDSVQSTEQAVDENLDPSTDGNEPSTEDQTPSSEDQEPSTEVSESRSDGDTTDEPKTDDDEKKGDDDKNDDSKTS